MADKKRLIDANAMREDWLENGENEYVYDTNAVLDSIDAQPTVDAVEVPKTGIGDLSDGYHTFNGLYYQRMILFASLVKIHSESAWKSYRHEDGELCFGGGWFIVGIDTPDGSYTYHYESKYFDLFDCVELPAGKHWDGHTEDDVTRLLSLQATGAVEVVHGRWIVNGQDLFCSHCDKESGHNQWGASAFSDYCPNCGAKMDGGNDDG